MYCRNCGQQISENVIACPKCGADPKTEKNFCCNCGAATNANQVMCIKCGVSLVVSHSVSTSQDNGRSIAIIAHVTFIGTIVALVMNNQNKTELGSFYVRQMVGLIIFNLIGFITAVFIIGDILLFLNFIVWIISFVNAINEKLSPMLVYGSLFQKWFKGL
jgi:hypothetical protein